LPRIPWAKTQNFDICSMEMIRASRVLEKIINFQLLCSDKYQNFGF